MRTQPTPAGSTDPVADFDLLEDAHMRIRFRLCGALRPEFEFSHCMTNAVGQLCVNSYYAGAESLLELTQDAD